jgi:hypothetical protein
MNIIQKNVIAKVRTQERDLMTVKLQPENEYVHIVAENDYY